MLKVLILGLLTEEFDCRATWVVADVVPVQYGLLDASNPCLLRISIIMREPSWYSYHILEVVSGGLVLYHICIVKGARWGSEL